MDPGFVEDLGDERVNVVNPDEFILDQDFSFFWCWDWKVGLVLEDFCSTRLIHDYAFHCFGDLGCHCSCWLMWFAQLGADGCETTRA
jgi:hypothetical protein